MLIHLNVILFPLTPQNTPLSRLNNSSKKEKLKRNVEKPKGITSALPLRIGKLCDIGMFIPAGSTFFMVYFFSSFSHFCFLFQKYTSFIRFFRLFAFRDKTFFRFQTLAHTLCCIHLHHTSTSDFVFTI